MNNTAFPLVFPRKYPDSLFLLPGRAEHCLVMPQQESLPPSDEQPWHTLLHGVETGPKDCFIQC